MPIDMSAAGKYQYLGGSLNSMLAGRLTSDGNVAVVDSVISKQDLKLLEGSADNSGSVFEKLGVDYVGSGSCYETEDGLKLQVRFYSSRQGVAPITVTMTTETDSAILSELDTFASAIKNRVLGFDQYTLNDAASGNEGLGAFQTAHPEKAYKMGEYTGPASDAEKDETLISKGVRTTITLNDPIINMASGDLDGDGQPEYVLLAKTGLIIVTVDDDRLRVIGEHKFSAAYKANRVHVADVNGDGKAEIYVSGDQRFSALSLILSWNRPDGVTVLVDKIKWYIRPVMFKNRKPVLIGQRSSRNLDSGFLARGIYELDEKDGKYVGWKRFELPEGINIFDFALADLNGDSLPETLAINRNDKLSVYSSTGELLTVSDQEYGGSLVHFGPTTAEIQRQSHLYPGAISKEKAEGRFMVYIPEPILVMDVDGDGNDEILVGKNKFEGARVLVNSRSYSGGTVACLKWDGEDLNEIWKTRKYPTYLSAYSAVLTDQKGASQEELGGYSLRMVVTYAGKRSLLGLSVADKTKVESFTYEIKQ